MCNIGGMSDDTETALHTSDVSEFHRDRIFGSLQELASLVDWIMDAACLEVVNPETQLGSCWVTSTLLRTLKFVR